MTQSSGLFTVKSFAGQEVLKYAPDGFVTINGALGSRIIAPAQSTQKKNLEIRGGITSITANCSLRPAGSSRCTIEVLAPHYKGLHEDYYVTLPNGTKIPYFVPMQEVKVFMKGRYLDRATKHPKYYPVFWGLITDVAENYNNGVTTFSLTCQDLLVWWKYQRITLKPSWQNSLYNAPSANRFATVFENMTAWEIIYTLFMDSFFIQGLGGAGQGRSFDFVYPKLSKIGLPPDLENKDAKEVFGGLVRDTITYWNRRFGFGDFSDGYEPSQFPLEMFGLGKPIKINSIRDDVLAFSGSARFLRRANRKAHIDLDFGVLAWVQPYGSFANYGTAAESMEKSKLDIAQECCDALQFEFFLDTNGSFVFKPPFFNLDVNTNDTPQYIIDQKDIITFNATRNSDGICNWLEVTAPIIQEVPPLENYGYHIDWDLVRQYGIRQQSLAIQFGNNPRVLRLIAAGEMARINGQTLVGSVSIPLRPEIRLGYPVYFKHIDAYYYVTAVNHNISFGSGATTDLSLECRRDRVFNDGSLVDIPVGACIKGYVYRWRTHTVLNTASDDLDTKLENMKQTLKNLNGDNVATEYVNAAEAVNLVQQDELRRQNNRLAGPKTSGLYDLTPAQMMSTKIESNGVTKDVVLSNELLMMTDNTIPFTDLKGYRHVGAFPYGAGLRLIANGDFVDKTNAAEVKNLNVIKTIGLNPDPEDVGVDYMKIEMAGKWNNSLLSEGINKSLGIDEKSIEQYQKDLEDARKRQDDLKNNPNPAESPEAYGNPNVSGITKAKENDRNTRTVIEMAPMNIISDDVQQATSPVESTSVSNDGT